MSLHIVRNITPEKSKKIVEMLYQNFIELAEYSDLKHNKSELTRLVTSPKSKTIFIIINGKIAAYLIGEVMELVDGRTVFYISYIFTSKLFRKQGFGSKLINYVEELSKKFNYDGILLTCDTENEEVYNFYLMKGFMPDLVLRQYKKHDVLYKNLGGVY
jgi:GNAT superfamily N-acetyltransferase